MTRSMFNGLEIDVPEGWGDVSTVVVAPRQPLAQGVKPSINLVVKRRPANHDDTASSLQTYVKFMSQSFGELKDIATAELMVGPIKAKSVVFSAVVDGVAFRQFTLLYFVGERAGGEEVSATVTQLEGDPTPRAEIEKLLRSVRRVTGVRGGR